MECLLVLVLLLLALLAFVPLVRMLFGKGPNNIRRLIRLDIAAFMVLTAGVALAFAFVRGVNPGEAACILVVALPIAIAFAWLGRYLIEDLVAGTRRRRSDHQSNADLSFLERDSASQPHSDDEPLKATVIDPDGDPPSKPD